MELGPREVPSEEFHFLSEAQGGIFRDSTEGRKGLNGEKEYSSQNEFVHSKSIHGHFQSKHLISVFLPWRLDSSSIVCVFSSDVDTLWSGQGLAEQLAEPEIWFIQASPVE